jgi:translation initiation factor IF-2
MSKVRIYDLAKELKLESKKVLEDARRMGVDVSVPSNTLDDNIAAKIREMYYPKKEQAPVTHKARLIKHQIPATPAATQPAPTTPETVPVTKAEQSAAAAPVLAEKPQPAGTAPATAAKTATPASQTTVKPIALPKPVPPAPKPVQPTPSLQATTPQVAQPAPQPMPQPAPLPVAPPPDEDQKQMVVKPVPPAPAKTEQAQAPEIEVEPAPVIAEPVPEPQVAKSEDKPVAAPEPKIKTAQPEVAATPTPAVRTSAGARPTGTKVIKLQTPARPMPKPAPPAPKPAAKPAPPAPVAAQQQAQVARVGEPKHGHEGRDKDKRDKDKKDKEVHLLPSGAQQRKVYIPPKDQRPKGRHQQRHKGEKDKFQEGNQQRLLPRKHASLAPAARAVPAVLKQVRLVEGSTVREFAEKLDAKPRDVVSALMQRGVMATINQTINPDVARDIGRQYGFDVAFGGYEDMIVESEFEITPEAMEDTEPRAPVITVMGHVDHGKTSLLDAIRTARVAEGEAGGITQHIGAYSVQVPNPDQPSEMRRVVFLDTPGHEAFTMMRARGAKVTDIVVLVVAADDGVMPQTIEAIDHAKAAGVPIVVAINKVDKPDANPERVKKELADRGLLWEGWGGDTTMVEVSAKKKQNIEGLLELVLLTADLLDLKSNPKRKATGTVLEAKLDRGRGAVATVLVQNGMLRVGDPFIVGNYFGKVRAMVNDCGLRVHETMPATPVEVLGLEGVPAAGDQFQVVNDVAKAQQISHFRQSKARALALSRTAARGLDQLAAQMESGEVKELLVILKADVQGSVEVLKDTLVKLSTERVKVRIIRAGVGAITYDDVLLGSASNATETGAATVIIGFNVRPEARADEAAKQEGVDIRLHSIIYKVEEEIRNAMLGLLEATTKEVVIGKAEIRDVIRVPKVGSVAGCMVINGTIKRTAHARLIRDNVVIFESQIGSLRRFKEDVSEVQQGYECGITIERFNDHKVGDVIEAFVTEKVAPTQL